MILHQEVDYNVLEENEIHELFLNYSNGDMKAREKLILHNLKFVVHIANKFLNKFQNIEVEELISVGIMGLIKAVDSFKLEKNTKFSTYSGKCIENEIRFYLRKYKKHGDDISIYSTLSQDAEGNNFTIEDILTDPNPTAEENIITSSEQEILHQMVEELPSQSKQIIQLYFGFYNNIVYRQEEIAKICGISQSYVSRVIRTTVKEIKLKYKKKI